MNLSGTTFWIIVMIVSVIIEIVTIGDLICIWFAVGALASLIMALLKLSTMVQYIAFFAVSIIVMLTVRPMAIEHLRGNIVPTNSDRFIGKSALLTKDITEEAWGQLSIGGSTWSCTSADNTPIPQGTRVRIIAIDGAKLIVKKSEQEV